MGSPTHGPFSITTRENFVEICSDLKKHLSVAYFILRIKYVIHITNTICVKWLFIVTGKASGQMRHLVVKFLGSQKSSADFWLHREVGTLLALLKGQPHFMGEWPVRLCAAHTLLNLPWEETREQARGHTADTRAGLGRGVWLHTQEAGETTTVFTSYCLQQEEHLESRSQQLHLTDTNNSWR